MAALARPASSGSLTRPFIITSSVETKREVNWLLFCEAQTVKEQKGGYKIATVTNCWRRGETGRRETKQ